LSAMVGPSLVVSLEGFLPGTIFPYLRTGEMPL
jgi:hypothetical protein